jgi:hypothetical protein
MTSSYLSQSSILNINIDTCVESRKRASAFGGIFRYWSVLDETVVFLRRMKIIQYIRLGKDKRNERPRQEKAKTNILFCVLFYLCLHCGCYLEKVTPLYSLSVWRKQIQTRAIIKIVLRWMFYPLATLSEICLTTHACLCLSTCLPGRVGLLVSFSTTLHFLPFPFFVLLVFACVGWKVFPKAVLFGFAY